jgi:hypothetical protein
MQALLASEKAQLVDLVTEFATERVRTIDPGARISLGTPEAVREQLHGMGLFPTVDEKYGGQGGPDLATRLLLVEALAYGDAGVAYDLVATAAAIQIIQAAGSESQREQLLPRFAASASHDANVLYYEGSGRTPAETRTAATKTPAGWTIRGSKKSVVRPDAAATSVLFATVDGELSVFVVGREASTPTVARSDDAAVGKLGLQIAPIGDLDITDLEVPEGSRLEPSTPQVLHAALAWYRLSLGAIALGVAMAALRYSVAYAKERVAFGRSIIDFQGVEFPLVNADIALDAARENLQASWLTIESCHDVDKIARLSSRAYGTACSAAVETTKQSINTLGGHGYITDHPVERWYRDASVLAAIDFDPIEHTPDFA